MRGTLVSFSTKRSSGAAFGREPVASERRVLRGDGAPGRVFGNALRRGLGRAHVPVPGVAEPEGRQDVERRRLGPAVGRGDADQDVIDAGLGVFDRDVEVAALVEDAGVEQLELRLAPAAPRVLLDETLVRERRLRILVEKLHVGMGGRGVEIEVVLLDVFAVVALRAGQPEETLFEDGVAPVPEGQRETEPLVVVRDTSQPVLAPAVSARARVIVREVVPGGAPRAVVLAYRAPLALGEVGAPASPVGGARLGVEQPLLLSALD